MMEENKKALLMEVRVQREKAIFEYQINIDNFKAAMEEIRSNHADDETLKPFLNQLKERLASEILEQKKEKIMLKVLEDQLK